MKGHVTNASPKDNKPKEDVMAKPDAPAREWTISISLLKGISSVHPTGVGTVVLKSAYDDVVKRLELMNKFSRADARKIAELIQEKIELADVLENNGAAKAIRECVDENDRLKAELAQTKLTQLNCDDINEKNKERIKELEAERNRAIKELVDMEAQVEKLKAHRANRLLGESVLREQRLVAAMSGCSDSNCVLVPRGKRTGMRTNGGCHCAENIQAALLAHRGEG